MPNRRKGLISIYIQDLYQKGFDQSKTQFVLSLSYGKDSMASIHVIKDILKLPLDRIVTADVWATDTISASLPPVEEFKVRADEWILNNYGIEVEHFQKHTFSELFYRKMTVKDEIRGWPVRKRMYCTSDLKRAAMQKENTGKDKIQYIGIATDEPIRVARHIGKKNLILPLVEAGWDEDMCGLWCKYAGVLSPTYTTSYRDGCWFCPNQSVDQLRRLRHDWPELWDLMLEWDAESPVTFHPDGHTVLDFDRRFRMEDEGVLMPNDRKFRWSMVEGKENVQLRLF